MHCVNYDIILKITLIVTHKSNRFCVILNLDFDILMNVVVIIQTHLISILSSTSLLRLSNQREIF